MKEPSQLDIWWINLDPTRGAETKKQRPCVVIQDNMFNIKSRTFLVTPILPGHKDWPFAINIKPTEQNGLDKERYLNLKQTRSVDLSRFVNKQGVLEQVYLIDIQKSFALLLGNRFFD